PLLLLLLLADDVEEAGLLRRQIRGVVLVGRVLVQPDLGRLGDEPGSGVVDEDRGAPAECDALAVRQEVGIALPLRRAGELPDGAGRQVLEEDVALAGVGLPLAVAAAVAAG